MDNRPQSRVKRVTDRTVKVEKRKIDNSVKKQSVIKGLFGKLIKK